jgi:uncharacterized protein YciW
VNLDVLNSAPPAAVVLATAAAYVVALAFIRHFALMLILLWLAVACAFTFLPGGRAAVAAAAAQLTAAQRVACFWQAVQAGALVHKTAFGAQPACRPPSRLHGITQATRQRVQRSQSALRREYGRVN